MAETRSEAAPTYECLVCGALVSDPKRPDTCSVCDRTGTFQNRAQSLE